MTKAKARGVTDEFWSRVEPLNRVRQRVAEQAYLRKTGGGRTPKDLRSDGKSNCCHANAE